jgi:sporulation protein YlmC with PRC-barrel domain
MSKKKVRLDLVLGRSVRDVDGKHVGRIQDVRGAVRGDVLEVVDYLVGTAALWQRLGGSALRLIGLSLREPLRVPWYHIDITDPEEPRFLGKKDDLKGSR